jgi:hypothetical protein
MRQSKYNYFSPNLRELLHYSEVRMNPISIPEQSPTADEQPKRARKSVYQQKLMDQTRQKALRFQLGNSTEALTSPVGSPMFSNPIIRMFDQSYHNLSKNAYDHSLYNA